MISSSAAPPRYFNPRSAPHITTLVMIAGVGAITMNIYLSALPEMARYFDQPYSVMQFTLTGYLALMGLAQPFVGAISDHVGRRPVMLVSLVIFTLASLGAALSESFVLFMIFRCLQSIMVAGFVISRAAVRDMVAREHAASMLGYVAMGMALAPMIAPPFGGMLSDGLGWQSNFYFLALIGVITLVIVAFDQGETNIHKSESYTAQFKTYPDLLRSRRFWGYALTLLFSTGTFFAYLGGAPFVGDKFFDLSATEVGLYLAITPLGYMVGSGVSGRYAQRIGIDRLMLTGALVTMLVMSLTLVTAYFEVAHPMGFFGFTFAIGFGNGLVLPAGNAGMLDVKPELAGSAAGLGGALTTLGGAILSSLTGFLLSETSGIYPLIWCILGSSLACLIAIIYTTRIEREVRMNEPKTGTPTE